MANRFQLWGQAGWASAEVVGETHYAKAIRALFGSDFDPKGTDITVPVQLIPDRNNRHDRNAVGVWSGSSLLGHLPRPEAARYVQVLSSLTSRNLVPEVNARIHGREWGAYDGRPAAFDATVRLDLAEPHMLVPANSPPVQEHRLLPSGSAVQVIGQQQFLDALRPVLRPEGECWVYVTLHEMADHLVEVRVGDARVGDLSTKISTELLPALRHLAEQGLVTAARAMVKGNDGKAEVMLYVARAQDLPESLQGAAARQAALASVSPAGGFGSGGFPAAQPASAGFPAAQPASAGFPAGQSGSGGFAGGQAASAGYSPGPASFPSGPASAQAGAAATGRASASVPTSGVASTGPATTGSASGGYVPGPAGSPSAAPAGVPGWAAPNEPVPSWAAPAPADAEPSRSPGWTSPLESDSGRNWVIPGESDSGRGRTLPGESESGRGWAAQGEADAESGPAWPGQGDPDAVPSWATAGEPASSWAAASEPELPRGGAMPSWAVPSGGIPSWATSSHEPLPTLPSTGALPGGSLPRLDPPGSTSGAVKTGAPGLTEPVGAVATPAASPLSTLGAAARAPLAPEPVHPISPAPDRSAALPDRSAALLDGAAIAETTVIPALTAVVKSNAARRSGVAPVSAAPENNPHPQIPPAPTGIKFAVPPGWPVPPDGWYPPEGWRPDAGWPLAPAGWQWWIPTWE
ncbi:hypothetical protein AB0M02_12390 [Actinoplanes sp. NPDC051861]|uniref:hypothetical protein n=1 Tax=Actinoplanes sp. NPDC051861 TaxID=3155170 RepID=UPI003433ED67